jgi:Protein of unknown function (DUF2868)
VRVASNPDEKAAREVLLLQAFETARSPTSVWSPDDRAWVNRLAAQEIEKSLDAAAQHDQFILRRAHHAMQRLLPRVGVVSDWAGQTYWQPLWWLVALCLGGVLGLVADGLSHNTQINLLAGPFWLVIVWNITLYLGLTGHALAQKIMPFGGFDFWLRLKTWVFERVLRQFLRVESVLGSSHPHIPVFRRFSVSWLKCCALLYTRRVTILLHFVAMGLGAGLIVGLYSRGLVFDYRVVWESTFLSANTVRDFLNLMLAPALWMSGQSLPDAATLETMRATQGVVTVGAAAAPWIHRYALMLMCVVVLPRLVLAWWAQRRARSCLRNLLSTHKAQIDNAPYFKQLTVSPSGEATRVLVVPYANKPAPEAALSLHTLFSSAFGAEVQLQLAPTVPFGAEDHVAGHHLPLNVVNLVVALFDLTATPEQEHHGRWALHLATQVPTVLLIDETSFKQRFVTDSTTHSAERLADRREIWRELARMLGTHAVFVSWQQLEVDAPLMMELQKAVHQPCADARVFA